MHIIRKTFGEMDNNCYILFDRDGGEAYIIDPGYEAGKIEAEVKKTPASRQRNSRHTLSLRSY